MELNKGMYQDTTLDKTPQGAWRVARNIVVGQSLRNVVNERGFNKVTNMGNFDGIIIGFIEMNNDVVFFTQNGAVGEIVVFNDMLTYQRILRSTALNFSIDNPIRGDYTYNFKGERIITWWDGLADDANVPKVLNIDCLPFEVDVLKQPLDVNDLNLLKLFPNLGCLDITLNSVNDGGGAFKIGAYWIVLAYLHPDGSLTNFSLPSNPIHIVDEDYSSKFRDIDGAEGDVLTTKSITITLNNLSNEFSKLVIGIVARNNGIITAKTLSPIKYSATSRTVTLTNLENSTAISLGLLLTPNASFTRVHTGVFLENRLHLGNLKKDEILDYQPYANNIKTKWVREDNINIGTFAGSYKDPVTLFTKKGFSSDEVYAFYVAFGMKDGTISQWFHIPGADAKTIGIGAYTDRSTVAAINATNPSNDLAEALLVNGAGKYFHFFNNAQSNGDMSFWENEDETYPDTDCFDIKNNLGVVTGNIRGAKVRHHKFPSLKLLNDWGNIYYPLSAGTINEILFDLFNTGATATSYALGDALKFDYPAPAVVSPDFTVTSTTDLLHIDVNNTVNVWLGVSLSVTGNSKASSLIFIKDAAGNPIFSGGADINGNIFFQDSNQFNDYFEITLNAGWTIEILTTRENTIDAPRVFASLRMTKNNFEDIFTTSKVMGVQFNDIYVPTEIQDKVTCLYFGYAQRTTTNSTKVCMTAIERVNFEGLNTQKEFTVKNFDLLANKPNVTISYLKNLFKFDLQLDTTNNTVVDNNLLVIPYVYDELLRAVKSFKYTPLLYFQEDGETLIEDTFYIETESVFTLPTVTTPTSCTLPFANLYNFITNAYYFYTEQQIAILTAVPLVTTSVKVYNGDTVLSYGALNHQLQLPAAAGIFESTNSINYLVESISNIEYRHGSEENPYAPKYISPNPAIQPIIRNQYLYNKDYSTSNNLLPQIIFECEDVCIPENNRFPLHIARSLVSNSEDGQTSWRTFKINEYYIMKDRDKGEVYRLDKYGGSLMINQLYSFFIAQVKDIIYTNDTDIYVARGDIFDRDPREVVQSGKANAYAGCQSLWGAKVCKQGYMFIDANAGKVFVYKGELQEISANGMYHFFENTLRRLGVGATDNPFDDEGVTLGFDGYENRLLLTKLGNEQPYTISYSFHRDFWIAFHDYLPNAYIDNNKGNFCIRNKDGIVPDIVYSRFYEMNVFNKYARYFNEFTIDLSYIDVVFTFEELVRFMSVYWETEVSQDEILLGEPIRFNETLTHIMAYDNHRCTGLMTVGVGGNLLQSIVRRVLEGWQYNDVRDIAISKDVHSVDKFGTINVANLNNNKIFFKKSVFIGKFVVVRFMYDNTNGRRVIMKDFNVNINQSER